MTQQYRRAFIAIVEDPEDFRNIAEEFIEWQRELEEEDSCIQGVTAQTLTLQDEKAVIDADTIQEDQNQ